MKIRTIPAVALLALGIVGSAWTRDAVAARLEAGTPIDVRLDSKISTEHASRGDTWTGTVSQSVVQGGRVLIPAGSRVTGTVTQAAQGTHSTKPSLDLAVRQVTVDGRSHTLRAETEPIVGGSKRAKKIGAIAGGAAVGALIGRGVAKDKHGTLIGGLLGGAAGYGLTRNALRTLQLKPGTVVRFTTTQDMVAMR
jgi:hypothetical protein